MREATTLILASIAAIVMIMLFSLYLYSNQVVSYCESHRGVVLINEVSIECEVIDDGQ